MTDNVGTVVVPKPVIADTREGRTETIILGPDYAEFLLKRNNRNRPVSHLRVARYAKAMKQGRWRFTGDAIQIDTNGDLLNGQKRLHAVVLSGVTITVNLVTGLPPEAQRYMDQGQSRSAANQLAIEGVPNSAVLAAISRLLLAWEANTIATSMKGTLSTNDEIIEFGVKHRDELQRAIILADRVRKNVRVATAPVGAVAYRALSMDDEAAELFFAELAHGANLDLGSPILTFRNHVMKLTTMRTRRTSVEIIYLTILTWNAWRQGRTDMYRIQLPKGGVTDSVIPKMF